MNGANPSWSFRDRCVLAAVLAVAAIFLAIRFGEFPVGAGMDDAYYIEMARSLAAGRGPVILLNGDGPGLRPDIFPLGFPLLLTPLALMFPDSVAVFKLVPLLAAAALFPICLLLARRSGTRRGLLLAALVGLNPWVIAFSVRVFSDLPFTAVSLAAVLLYLELDRRRTAPTGLWAALVAATAAAVMIRSIGLALPLAMVVHLLARRRWRRAVIIALAVTAALVPHALAGGGSGAGLVTRAYLAQVLGGGDGISWRLSLVAGNLLGYLRELPAVLLPVFGIPLENLAARAGLGAALGPLQSVLGAGLTAGVVRGLVAAGRADPNRARFMAIYLAVYAAVLLNFAGYPSGVQARLLLPVLPLLYLSLLDAGDRAHGRTGRSAVRAAVVLALTFALGHNAYRAVRPLNAEGGFIDPGAGAEWIRSNTDPADVIMARWPLRQHIHFLRPVVGFGTVGSEDIPARVARYGVRYVVLDSRPPEPGRPDSGIPLGADPRRFVKVFQDDGAGVTIFRVGQDP